MRNSQMAGEGKEIVERVTLLDCNDTEKDYGDQEIYKTDAAPHNTLLSLTNAATHTVYIVLH